MAEITKQMWIEDNRQLSSFDIKKVEKLFSVNILLSGSHLTICGERNGVEKAENYLTCLIKPSSSVCYIHEYNPENEQRVMQSIPRLEECSTCHIQKGESFTLLVYGVSENEIGIAISLLDAALTEESGSLDNSDCFVLEYNRDTSGGDKENQMNFITDDDDDDGDDNIFPRLILSDARSPSKTGSPAKSGDSSGSDAVIDLRSDDEVIVIQDSFVSVDDRDRSLSNKSLKKKKKRKKKNNPKTNNDKNDKHNQSTCSNEPTSTSNPMSKDQTSKGCNKNNDFNKKPNHSQTKSGVSQAHPINPPKRPNPLPVVQGDGSLYPEPFENLYHDPVPVKHFEVLPSVPWNFMPRRLRKIVMDGSNIAMLHGLGKVFSCKGIELVIQYFESRGHKDIAVFVPQWRRSRRLGERPIKNPEILEKLFGKGQLHFTPSREIPGKLISSYDDRFVLNLATDEGGIVISNDQYRDLYSTEPKFRETIEKRLLQVTFVGDKVMFPDDPLGRNGPSLDDFLSFDPAPRLLLRPPIQPPDLMRLDVGWSGSWIPGAIRPMAFPHWPGPSHCLPHDDRANSLSWIRRHQMKRGMKAKKNQQTGKALKNIVKMALNKGKNHSRSSSCNPGSSQSTATRQDINSSRTCESPGHHSSSPSGRNAGAALGRKARTQKITESLKRLLLDLPYATASKVDEVLTEHSTVTDVEFLKGLL